MATSKETRDFWYKEGYVAYKADMLTQTPEMKESEKIPWFEWLYGFMHGYADLLDPTPFDDELRRIVGIDYSSWLQSSGLLEEWRSRESSQFRRWRNDGESCGWEPITDDDPDKIAMDMDSDGKVIFI